MLKPRGVQPRGYFLKSNFDIDISVEQVYYKSMTKKCLISFLIYVAFFAIMLISMHLMLLADVNKYVGVGVGGGIMAVAVILSFAVKSGKIKPFVLALNAIACGIAISSLYIYLGRAPQIWQSAVICAALTALFAVYCLIVNIKAIKYHPIISFIVYLSLVLVSAVVGACLSDIVPFSLALMAFVPFASFLITTALRAKDVKTHIYNITCTSFAALVIVIIVVLIVISEGEIADGLDFPIGGDGGSLKKKRVNPYDFVGYSDYLL